MLLFLPPYAVTDHCGQAVVEEAAVPREHLMSTTEFHRPLRLGVDQRFLPSRRPPAYAAEDHCGQVAVAHGVEALVLGDLESSYDALAERHVLKVDAPVEEALVEEALVEEALLKEGLVEEDLEGRCSQQQSSFAVLAADFVADLLAVAHVVRWGRYFLEESHLERHRSFSVLGEVHYGLVAVPEPL